MEKLKIDAGYALPHLKGIVGALKDMQDKHGEFAKIHCSAVEESLMGVIEALELEQKKH